MSEPWSEYDASFFSKKSQLINLFGYKQSENLEETKSLLSPLFKRFQTLCFYWNDIFPVLKKILGKCFFIVKHQSKIPISFISFCVG